MSVHYDDKYRRILFRLYFGRYIPTELQTEYIEFKKKDGSLMWKFLLAILSTESPRDSNRDLRTVT
jgi:hypothetical protein